MASDNVVTMSLSSYNQIKADNTKFNMFIDRLLEETSISDNKLNLQFDEDVLNALVRLVYPERYKKRLSHLRGVETKIAQKEDKERRLSNEL